MTFGLSALPAVTSSDALFHETYHCEVCLIHEMNSSMEAPAGHFTSMRKLGRKHINQLGKQLEFATVFDPASGTPICPEQP